jgi:NADPH:quinone reductase-like Zn-dependent oxidoreductase
MKAAWIANALQGDLSIVVGETEAPSASGSGMLVAVDAVGLTFGEVHWVTNGALPLPSGEPRPLPVIIGHEFAGRVVDPGSAGQTFRPGDRVFGLIDFWRNGAAAELAQVLPSEVAALPASISAVQAATLPIGALTAWQGLVDHGQLKRGDLVLIHGGSGAVGSFAIQIAKDAGATVIATARGEAGTEFCRRLGADMVIDTSISDFEEVAGRVDLIFDTVGGQLLERSWAVVSKGGHLVTISGEAEDAPSAERARSLGIEAAWFIVKPDAAQLAELAARVADGRLLAKVDAVFPLEEAQHVYSDANKRPRLGKTVLSVGSK